MLFSANFVSENNKGSDFIVSRETFGGRRFLLTFSVGFPT